MLNQMMGKLMPLVTNDDVHTYENYLQGEGGFHLN